MDLKTVVVRGRAGELRQDVQSGRHQLVVDEPVADGGTDAGPTTCSLPSAPAPR